MTTSTTCAPYTCTCGLTFLDPHDYANCPNCLADLDWVHDLDQDPDCSA